MNYPERAVQRETFNIGSGRRIRTTWLSFGIFFLMLYLKIFKNHPSYRKAIIFPILPISYSSNILTYDLQIFPFQSVSLSFSDFFIPLTLLTQPRWKKN